jgi:hypothetical protein
MPRDCRRARLECGLKLDINRAIRDHWIMPGVHASAVLTFDDQSQWTITANLTGPLRGYLRIQINALDQWIELEARPRHFGGRQWFFLCPRLNQRCTVLWKPPGAHSFACRQAWGRQVAYLSQCIGRDDRAHRGQAKIRSRLCQIGGFNSDEWDLPPKPKWMRWRTYNRAIEKFDHYESMLAEDLPAILARLEWLLAK